MNSATDDEYDDEPEDDDKVDLTGLFPFMLTEKVIVDEVVLAVRSLLHRPSISAEQICQIGKLLFGLERLPERISGLYMSLIVGVRQGGESGFVTITLTDEFFELGNEGSMSSEFGSDSFSDKVFELEHQDRGRSDIFEMISISGWIEELKNSAVDSETIVEVEDLGGSIDWDSEPTTDGWDQIAKCVDFYV